MYYKINIKIYFLLQDGRLVCLFALLGANIEVKEGVKFKAETFLKKWVDFCTNLRVQYSLEGDLLGVAIMKLVLNSVFGVSIFLL